MSNSEVLREFLVRIAYDNDRVSEERFIRGIESATDLVKRLGTAVVAAAGTVGIAAVRIATTLEGLYYSSRRVGSSADAIRGFTYAVSQMGGTADEAQASLENLQRAMRDNPGVRGMVQSLVGPGVNTNDAVATMRALGATFRQMPRHVARLYANQLGIDERTFDAITQGTDRFERRYQELARKMGVSLTDASGQARNFGQAWRELMLLLDLSLAKLMPALERFMPLVTEKFVQLVNWVERVTPQIDEFITKTVGWENALIILGAALTLHLLSPLTRIVATLGILAGYRLPAWLLQTLGVGGVAAGALILRPSDTNQGEQEGLERLRRGEDPFPDQPQVPRRPDGSVIQEPSLMDRVRRWWNGGAQPSSAPLPTERQQQLGRQAMEFFERAGLSAQSAAGIVANLQGESGLRADAFNPAGGGRGAFGLAQWRGDRQEALARFASERRGQPITAQQTTFEEQLAFILDELRNGTDRGAREAYRQMQGARSPAEAAEIFTRLYERPEAHKVDNLARVRGQGAERWFASRQPPTPAGVVAQGPRPQVNVQQRTEIIVQGSNGSPEWIARRVGEEQRAVNSDLTRNLETAAR